MDDLSLEKSEESEAEYLERLLKEKERRKKFNRIDRYYPAEGPLRRELYPKHMEFFAAGKKHRERACMAANRVGKTEGILCYESALHLTGDYPKWWRGYRFERPIICWLGGTTNEKVKEIVQAKMVGDEIGSGMLRGDLIVDTVNKRGMTGAIETVKIKHASGRHSILSFKSYDQGREAWQGNEVDLIGLDEEAPQDIRTEAFMRTMTTQGLLIETFTPMKGVNEVIMSYLNGDKYYKSIEWDDVPHLTAEQKKAMMAAIPANERDARMRGVPSLGVGKIYQVSWPDIFCEPFEIPKHWNRGYGMDVGWNRTAAIWGALDRDSDVLYLYSEHYQGSAEPAVHAAAIKSRGEIWGAIDPASRASSQKDGEQLIELYRKEGLKLVFAKNAREAGIFEVWQRMSTGRLKVFCTLSNWKKEFDFYHRNEKGEIVKKNDHIMDATRYLVMTADQVIRPQETSQRLVEDRFGNTYHSALPRGRFYRSAR